MSKQDHQTNQQKLKELLQKGTQQPGGEVDAFEKEALEGFNHLGSQEESFRLKQKLDKRMYAEVFTDNKIKAKSYYWLAAASLFLIIGFSTYYVSVSFSNQPKDLALVSQKPSEFETKAAPSTLPLKKQTETNAPVVSETIKYTPAVPEAKNKLKEKAIQSEPEAASNQVSFQNSNQIKALSKGEAKEDHIDTEKTASQEAVVSYDSEVKELLAKQTIETSAITSASNKKSKKHAAPAKMDESTTAMAAPAAANTGAGIGTLICTCNYTGGYAAFLSDLKKALTSIGLEKTFSGIVRISNSKQIEKIEFTKADVLNKNEKEQVLNVFKSLEKISIPTNTLGCETGCSLSFEFVP